MSRHPKTITLSALVLLGASAMSGCDLPTIPANLHPDMALPLDLGASEMGEPLVCVPGSRACFASNVRICAPDGLSFRREGCALNEVCREGACAPAKETCENSSVLAISQTRMLFEVDEALKPSGAPITLTNCTDVPLYIQKASIASPESLNGTLVYDFDLSTRSPQGLTLNPGESVSSKILFRPRDHSWIERGTLYLTIEGGPEIITRQVDMIASAWCVSISPLVDFGLMPAGQQVSRPLTVHNCGSRSLLLSGAELDDDSQLLEWGVAGLEKPLSLQAGQSAELTLDLTPAQPGTFSQELELVLQPGDARQLVRPAPPARLSGRIIDSTTPCLDILPSSPRLDALTSRPDEGDLPLTLYTISSALPDPGWSALHEVRARAPFGTPPLTQAAIGTSSTLLVAYMQGDYIIETTWIDPQGVPTCTTHELELSLTTPGEYYIELVWHSLGDPVPEDEAGGLGVDLDLHARYGTGPQDRDTWRDPGSCTGKLGACARGLAEVISVSASGGLPEALVVSKEKGWLELGVHVKNANLFSGACAQVRVWRAGELLAQIPRQGDEMIGCEQGRSIQGSNSFWSIGTLELDTGALDTATQTILPRGVPRD